MNLALNNQQRLICHKTQPTNQPTNQPFNLMRKKLKQYLHFIAFCVLSTVPFLIQDLKEGLCVCFCFMAYPPLLFFFNVTSNFIQINSSISNKLV